MVIVIFGGNGVVLYMDFGDIKNINFKFLSMSGGIFLD